MWQSSIRPVLWGVAGTHRIVHFGTTLGWILIISRLAQATRVLSSNMSSHPKSVLLECGLSLLDSHWTRFNYVVLQYSIQQAFTAVGRSVSGLSKYREARTFSIILAKHGYTANTLLILALPSFRSLWLFPLSMLSFSPDCWLLSWASQDKVRPFPPRLLMKATKVCCITYAMYPKWFLNAGHSIRESSTIHYSTLVIECFEKTLSVVLPSNWPSVSSIPSRTSFNCVASLGPVCGPLPYHAELAFKRGKEQVIYLIQRAL